MLDPTEQQLWFEAYLAEGLLIDPTRPVAISVWARSMSLISEQFTDHYLDSSEDAEAGA